MNQSLPATPVKHFADLQQQIAAMVCNTPVAADQLGRLPKVQMLPTPRAVLHLNTPGKAPVVKPLA